jgi:hypothetical protein
VARGETVLRERSKRVARHAPRAPSLGVAPENLRVRVASGSQGGSHHVGSCRGELRGRPPPAAATHGGGGGAVGSNADPAGAPAVGGGRKLCASVRSGDGPLGGR